ncbi:hypothetical protein [Massilia sp. METH4]|uniref:hypothetical protein n=1 Tax=Massilia sp. METH4 TaxID=3123041 RepID=UPI0030D1D656
MDKELRADLLKAQIVDVALVLKQMLGVEEAVEYLYRNGIGEDTIKRVLHAGMHRAPAESPPLH